MVIPEEVRQVMCGVSWMKMEHMAGRRTGLHLEHGCTDSRDLRPLGVCADRNVLEMSRWITLVHPYLPLSVGLHSPFSPTPASNRPKGGYSTLSKHQERKTKFCPNGSLNETYNPMANETNTITISFSSRSRKVKPRMGTNIVLLIS